MRLRAKGRERAFPASKPGNRVCTQCRVEKHETMFVLDKKTPSGRGSWCLPCKKAKAATYRHAPDGVFTEKDIGRFWKYVNKNGPTIKAALGPCWEWTGGKMAREGYGRLFWEGNMRPAHAASWKIHCGTIPADHVVDHLCQHRTCVNPAHLRAVTRPVSARENNESPLARNARKTHCIRGHEFTPENTVLYTPKTEKLFGRVRGKSIQQRQCLTCRREVHTARAKAKKAAKKSQSSQEQKT